MTRIAIVLLSLAASAFGQVSNFRVVGVTNTQAIFYYETSFAGNCSIEVSESDTYAPPVHDVNNVYFSGSDSDSRFSSLRDGQIRYFVAGTRAVHEDAAGVRRSRALQAWTRHYARVSCNGSQTTTTFQTATVNFGNTFADLPPIDVTKPAQPNYMWPTLNPMYHDGKIIDPFSGVRLQYVNTDAWAQGRTTDADGDVMAGATADAGWTPTSSTLTAAIATGSDGNVATSSTADKLRLQLSTGGTKLTSGTFPAGQLSYQNLKLRYRCVGSGCGSAVAHLCATDTLNDVTPACLPPEKTWSSLATSMGDLTVCKDVPCTVEKNPGDWFTYEKTFLNGQYASSRRSDFNVYTSTGVASTLKFISATDCNRLYNGEIIGIYKSTADTDYRVTIGSIDCGASPPQATITAVTAGGSSVSAPGFDHNGDLGVPFTRPAGIGSPRYGFLLWITGADAALEVDSVAWIAAKDPGLTLSPGSGGFGKKSTYTASANGFFHAACGLECYMGYKPEADGSTTVRYLGWTTPYSSTIGSFVTAGHKNCDNSSTNNANWSDTDANVFYCVVASNYPALNGAPANRSVLLRLTYTGNDVASAAPCAVEGVSTCATYGPMQGQTLPVTVENLTPCLGDCTDPDQDFTIWAQLKRHAGANWDHTKFASCGAGLQQGNYILGGCQSGSQDSWSVLFVMDLGNGGIPGSTYVGTSGNTQQIVNFLDPNQKKFSRFCGNHTSQPPIGITDTNIAITEVDSGKCYLRTTVSTNLTACTNSSGSGSCQACPAGIGTIDGVDYEGTNRCWLITLNSTWNGAWGTAPAGFETGDPVGQDIDEGTCGTVRWFSSYKVGDLICRSGECLKFLKKSTTSQWYVERQFGSRCSTCSGGSAPNHGSDSSWATKCNAMELNSDIARTETLFGGWQWHYLADPGATGFGTTYGWTRFNNHAFHVTIADGVGVRLVPKFIVEKLDFSDASAMAVMPTYNDSATPGPTAPNAVSANGWCVAGLCGDSFGNQIESHASMSQVAASAENRRTFLDMHPINFLTLKDSSNVTATRANVTGYLWKFAQPNKFYPKHNLLSAFTGTFPYINVSAPGAVLTGDAADNGKACIVYVAGECYAGSAVGEIYFNSTALDGQTNCREAEFATTPGDSCLTNMPPHGATVSEYLLPGEGQLKNYNLRGARVLTRVGYPYRSSVTGNVKASPDGTRILVRENPFIITVPPIPMLDTIDRSEFQAHTLSIKDVPAGTDNVIVRFGYDTSMICSPNRAELCVATEAAINRTTPYSYPSEGTGGVESGLTGLSCASSCSATLPLIPDRIAFYQVVYRNAGGATLRADPLKSVAK